MRKIHDKSIKNNGERILISEDEVDTIEMIFFFYFLK